MENLVPNNVLNPPPKFDQRYYQGTILVKIPSRKLKPLVDIEHLPKDFVKRKIALSDVSSPSSKTKEVKSCGKIKVAGPLGLEKGEALRSN